MKPADFPSAAAWRAWLERHHAGTPELVVRCWKRGAAMPGLAYSEALDEALCFGWIDGVRRRIDQDSFSVRFTPRRPRSVWSAVNIRRAEELEREGRMRPAGSRAFAERIERRSRVYSYENRGKGLAPAYLRRLRSERKAWVFFQAQPPGYRRTSAYWVMEAKREETRMRRLETLIACSAQGRRIPLLTRESASGGRARGHDADQKAEKMPKATSREQPSSAHRHRAR
ncbi:MAG TPA: YdeI/OmpD-associated family protein [Gemmatimonadales bacterium]